MKPNPLFLLSFALIPALQAQDSAATAAPASPPASDTVVTLSPFEVSSSAQRGYVTTSSTGASRVATPIIDLPTTLITINDKLIKDTLATDIGDTVNFVSGVNHTNQGTGSQNNDTTSIRGFSINQASRDGIPDTLMSVAGGFDYSYLDSIEIIKGPSGVLYGSQTPGGIINVISKRPLPKPQTTVSLSEGSFGSQRYDLDTSGYFDHGNQFGYRLSAAYGNSDGPLDFVGEPKGGYRSINPSFSYRNNSGLYLWAWLVAIKDDSNRLNYSAHAYLTSPGKGEVLFREAQTAHGNNLFHNLYRVYSNEYEVGASQAVKFGRLAIDARFVARWFKSDNYADRIRGIAANGGTDIFYDANGNILGNDSRTIPYSVAYSQLSTYGRNQVRLDQSQNLLTGNTDDLDLNFDLDLGAVKNRLLTYGTVTTSDGTIATNSYTITSLTKLAAFGAPIVNGVAQLRTWPTPLASLTGLSAQNVISQADVVALADSLPDNRLFAAGAIDRLSFLDDRLFVVGGLRRDSLRTTTQIVTGTTTSAIQTDDETTYNVSVLGKIYHGSAGTVSLYFNKNETFIPVYTIDVRLGPAFGSRFPDQTASTIEGGVKVDLLDSKVVATLSTFKIDETNTLVNVTDITGAVTGVANRGYSSPAGSNNTTGWDADINFVPARGWEVVLGVGALSPKLSTGGYNSETPLKTLSALTRYEFDDGFFKGLSLIYTYEYWGRSILGTRTNWWMPGGDNHAAIAAYKWRNWTLRLKVSNLYNEQKVEPSTFETAVGVTLPRNYRVGLSYSF